MALTTIEYGALASSSVINENFEYLEDAIGDVSDSLTSNVATLNSNISSLSNVVTTLNQAQTEALNDLSDELDAVSTVASYDTAPDYSSGYQISLPFTAPTDGYVYAGVNGQDDPHYVYVNNMPVLGHCGYSGFKWVYTGATFRVSKDDIVTASRADGTHYFYPMKGNQ